MENKLNLSKEIICDFEVTEKRKKIWQKELEILEKIIEICNKYDIKYTLCGGSLLGAVRHKGFIPWDDDIDISMKRDQYNKFLEIAEKEFEYPYFVQYYKTEKLYNRGHAQIRNSETTAILEFEATTEGKNNYNKGIFVDIFPLDNIPDEEEERKKFINKLCWRKNIIMMTEKSNSIIKRLIKRFLLKISNRQKQIYKFEKSVVKYNNIDTKQCAEVSFSPGTDKYDNKYDNKWFEQYIKLPFEYLEVECIKDYDELLKREYGDYMRIPENKHGGMHGQVFFDTEKSYKEYENEDILNIM